MSVLRIMAAEHVTAGYEQFPLAVVLKRNSGGKRLPRFGHGRTGANLTPKGLAALRIDGQQIRLILAILKTILTYSHIALQHSQAQFAVVECRTTAKSPLEGERPVILLDIAPPSLAAVKIKAYQVAIAIEEDRQLAVGHRRGR